MQNLTTTHIDDIRDKHIIPVPVSHAKTSFIDVRDIGAVGAKTLIDDIHHNQIYTLTGSEALTYFEVAEILSEILGYTITYTNPNPIRFFFRLLREGHAFSYALVVTALYSATRTGNAEAVTDDVPCILNRKPITFRQFAEDHRQQWLT